MAIEHTGIPPAQRHQPYNEEVTVGLPLASGTAGDFVLAKDADGFGTTQTFVRDAGGAAKVVGPGEPPRLLREFVNLSGTAIVVGSGVRVVLGDGTNFTWLTAAVEPTGGTLEKWEFPGGGQEGEVSIARQLGTVPPSLPVSSERYVHSLSILYSLPTNSPTWQIDIEAFNGSTWDVVGVNAILQVPETDDPGILKAGVTNIVSFELANPSFPTPARTRLVVSHDGGGSNTITLSSLQLEISVVEFAI